MKLKKGVSGVVVMVLLVALSIVVVAVVWGVVRNVVTTNLEDVESCFTAFDKVTINSMYTCYDFDAGAEGSGNFRFSINVGDIELEKIIVVISSEGETKNFELGIEENSDLKGYMGKDTEVPGKNSGKTYIVPNMGQPDLIKVAPVVDGKQCDFSDSLSEIDVCLS